jgi:hypothetical protein
MLLVGIVGSEVSCCRWLIGWRLSEEFTMRTLTGALLVIAPLLIGAQEEKERWQRIYTSEESIIEMNLSKVTFGASPVARVRFRTIFSKSQRVGGKTSIEYKTRLETIEFKCQIFDAGSEHYPVNATRYRLYEASLLDTKGQLVKSFEGKPSEDWKEVKFGSMMEKLSLPACKLIEEKRRNP